MRLATLTSLAAFIVLACGFGGCESSSGPVAGPAKATTPATAKSPAATATAPATPATKGLQVLRTIPGGGAGGWDYITIDSAAGKAYVGRSTRIMVMSLGDKGLLGEVADVSGAHGVAVVPALNLGFATAGKDGTVNVFDLKTFATLRKIKAGEKPDAILYDPASKKVFAFNHGSGEVTIIDPAKLDAAPVALPVGGVLEFGVADGAGKVYVNVEDKAEVAVIDSKQNKVVARWPVAPGTAPTGLAIDPAKRRLFVGCSNLKMIVLDADSGKVLGDVAVGAGVDGVAFDERLGLALSANGRDGTATAVGEVAPAKFAAVQTIATAKGARTVAADPDKHRFYFPCSQPSAGGKSEFGLLVVGQAGEK